MSTRSQLTKDLNASKLMVQVDQYLSKVIQLLQSRNDNGTESVKTLLGRHTKILVKYMIKLETKNDKTENRVLVFTPVRIYLLIAKVPTKIDCNFHYLDIQSIDSKNPTHFSIITNDRVFSFVTTGDAGNFSSNADVILTDLASAIKQLFPTVPLRHIIRKIDVQPIEREQIFSDEIRPSDPKNIGPCGGFSMQYTSMCDYHNVPYREEVSWDIDTIYLSHDNRILNLKDFDHLDSKDLMAIVSALEYNTFFRGLKITNTRLSSETLERILHILRRSMWLEELHLESLGLKSDFLHKLAVAVISNNNPAIKSIDLSHNVIEDKGATSICALAGKLVQGAIHLAGPIAKVSKGLCKLYLSHCGLTSKGVNQIAHSLFLNQSISNTLTHLDLSGNCLKDDINNLYNFLAQPNVLEHLNLSATDITLENLFGALLRGCGTHLSYLNVSHNSFSTKKGKEIPPSYKQFFTSSLSLKHLNIACCKLPLEALKNLLLGLACNESTANLYLDLSGNSLGLHGAHVLESCIHGVRVVHSLDISDNNLDAEMASVVTAIGRNPSIRCLYMTKCFLGMKTKNISTVMDSLVNFIQKDDCLLTKLVLSDNKLKTDLHSFVNALGSNQSLQELDISSNYMGDNGARLLAKALQINTKLKWISLDRNNITLQGFSDIVYALENNYSMKNIPFPLFDTAPCLKSHPEKTDHLMRKMQEYLQRNCNGFKRINGHGFRLQHGFLLSSTHQLVDKIVAECQETMSIQQNSLDINIQRLLDDAENCKQLLPKLQESLRCDPHPIETKLDKIVSEINDSIKLYLEEILNSMLQTGIDHCPKTLGNQTVINDLREQCMERLVFPEEFIQSCMFNSAGTEIMNKISEIEQSIASMIADRATDEVLEALTRYQKGLSISDSSYMISDYLTPDVIRRSSQDTSIFASVDRCDLNLPNLGLDSPTATPHLPTKRRSVARKLRPQSVVGLGIENLSLSHIPDLLDPNSHSNSQLNDKDDDDNDGDSITELPSASFQLQHLVKGRPKRAKTRAPTKALMPELQTQTLGEGLETFFGPGSATPSTLTPLVSPTSEECSSLSFVDSPTMSRDDTRYNLTSEETTPILEERKIIRGDRLSPVMKSTWNSRSLSSDNLEKYSPLADRKSPLIKLKTENDSSLAEELYDHQPLSLQHHHMPHYSSNHHKSSHHHYTSTHHTNDDDENSSIMTTSMGGGSGKNRPWSVAGSNESKSLDFLGTDGTGRQDSLDNSDVLPIKSSGGSIVGISPGAAMSGNNNSCGGGGGSIVGITPGAAMEKKSVRDLAAGLNRLGEQNNKPLTRPQVQPRVSRTSHDYQNVTIEPSRTEKPPEVVKRVVAGKKITAQFEETLVEGLQRKSFRHTIFKENQYSKDDSVDV